MISAPYAFCASTLLSGVSRIFFPANRPREVEMH
jgi:hypothetical protein